MDVDDNDAIDEDDSDAVDAAGNADDEDDEEKEEEADVIIDVTFAGALRVKVLTWHTNLKALPLIDILYFFLPFVSSVVYFFTNVMLFNVSREDFSVCVCVCLFMHVSSL